MNARHENLTRNVFNPTFPRLQKHGNRHPLAYKEATVKQAKTITSQTKKT